MRRHPQGRPTGGQFAGKVLARSGLELTGTPDPWASSDLGGDMKATCEEISHLLRPEPVVHTEQDMLASQEWHNDRQHLLDTYGSAEQAVITAGQQVAERGFEIAGMTPEQIVEDHGQRLALAKRKYEHDKSVAEAANQQAGQLYDEKLRELAERRDAAVHASVEEYEACEAALSQVRKLKWALAEALQGEVSKAHQRLHEIECGTDDKTKADLALLTDGYLSALSEVRTLGGDLIVSDKSKKPARDAFAEAVQIFPTDRIEASNDRIGRTRETTGLMRTVADAAPVVKVSKRRAHYADLSHQSNRRREQVTRNVDAGMAGHYLDDQGRPSNPRYDVRPLSAAEKQDRGLWPTENMLEVAEYEVNRLHDDPVTPPRGRGWEQWNHPEGDRTYWRRPRVRMRTVQTAMEPEITTNAGVSNVKGRSETFAVSAHELSHRFEYSVPGIKHLEAEFLTRRATDPETGEIERPTLLYPRSREYAVKDGFNIAYTGKTYGDGAREVLSTGIDQVFGGRHGASIGLGSYAADSEHRNFVLGLLATAGHKPN